MDDPAPRNKQPQEREHSLKQWPQDVAAQLWGALAQAVRSPTLEGSVR